VILALGLALLPAGCAYAQSPCFQNDPTNLGALLGTSCTIGTVTYTWTSYSCNSNPTSLCPTSAGNIRMSQIDGYGCTTGDNISGGQPYVILFLQSNQLNINNPSVDENVNITIMGKEIGATNNWNWPHFCYQDGQTNYGAEDNKTTVYCGPNCTGTLAGVSEIRCDKQDNVAQMDGDPSLYCWDQTEPGSSGLYDNPPFNATFNPPSGGGSDMFKVDIDVTAPAGTVGMPNSALIYSVGTHLQP